MLQQTQIATVLDRGYFTGWMEKFPDVFALAQASEAEILKAWEGLGYYRRARNLQKAAQAVVALGEFPDTVAGIRALPGVGDYTAGAVASFAYNLPAAIVDANVARVLARLFDLRDSIDSTLGKRQLWDWAEQLVAPDHPRAYNSGLMELGQRICRPTNPKCQECPVSDHCLTREPERLPVKKQRVETEEVDEHVLYLRKGDAVFLTQEEAGNRREGLWRFPKLDTKPASGRPEVLRSKYGITKYRVTLMVYRGEPDEAGEQGRWVSLEELEGLAMASPYRKALNRLLMMDSDAEFQLR